MADGPVLRSKPLGGVDRPPHLELQLELCLAADLARTGAGLFIMLARQSGARCQTNLEILTASIVLNGF